MLKYYIKSSLALIYFFINTLGAILFFRFGYQIVALAKLEERKDYDAVDGVTFFTNAFPVLFVCLFINLIWFLKSVFEIIKYRNYYSIAWFAIATIPWVASIFAIRLIS